MIDRRLKIRHVQAFVEIARQKSLKRAAAMLHLTQPAISKTLKELEQIAGVTLLERDRGGVQMTVEGEVFLRFATGSLTALGQAMQGVSAIGQGGHGTVFIGALPSVAARVLPKAVQIFREMSPHTIARIEDGPHGYLVDRLRSGALELVIGRLGEPESMTGVSFTQLYLEGVAIVCAPGHPLARANSLAQISTHLIVYPPQNAAIRPLVDKVMIANGISEFSRRVECVSAAFGRGMALTHDALWIISTGVVADDIAAGRLIALPLDLGLTAGPIGIMARADDDLAPLAQYFRQSVVKAVADLHLG